MTESPDSTIGRAFAPAAPESDFVEAKAQREVLAALFGGDDAPKTFDRFELIERVGSGAMGTVYSAHDPKLHRRVALKILRTSDEQARRRHLAEARALARLSHPGVVTVHDAGECDGHLYVAMEFVEGESLRSWLDGSDRTPTQIMEVFSQAGAGLWAAHRAGIIHRDFKPANVLVSQDDVGGLRARVADFGLARRAKSDQAPRETVDGPPSDALDTTCGDIVGTPLYMAPEQMERRAVDARADQFAYCVSLWEALSGAPPFPGPGWSERREQLQAGPPSNARGGPPWVMKILRRGMAYEPSRRFEDMAALLDALSGRRRRRQRGWIVGALVVCAGIGAYEAGRRSPTDPCGVVEARMAELWNDSRRDAIRQAFADSGVRYAEVSSASVIKTLDRYAAELSAAQHERCDASEAQGEAAEDTLCIRDAQSSLAATVAVLEAGHPETPKNAHRLVGQLPELEACLRVDGVPLPSDPKIRMEVLAAQEDLAKLRTAVHAGRFTDASEAQRLDTVAQGLGHQPLEADTAALVAMFAKRDGDLEAAAASFRRALFTAEEAGAAHIAGTAARLLAQLEMFDNLRLDRARDWLDLSRALHRRAGVADGLTNAVLMAEAQLAAASYDAAASVEWSQRMLERPSLPPVLRMSALDTLSAGQAGLGDLDAARDTFERALDLVTRELGEGHPYEIALLSNYGMTLMGARKNEEAEPLLRRAAEIAEATYGPSSPRTAELWLNRGINLQGTQQGADLLRRALKVLTAEYGEGHNKVEAVRINLGMGLIELGQLEEGLQLCETAAQLLPKDAGPEQRAHSANCRGVALYRLERFEEAVEILEPFVGSGAEGANTRSAASIATTYRDAKAAIESE